MGVKKNLIIYLILSNLSLLGARYVAKRRSGGFRLGGVHPTTIAIPAFLSDQSRYSGTKRGNDPTYDLEKSEDDNPKLAHFCEKII